MSEQGLEVEKIESANIIKHPRAAEAVERRAAAPGESRRDSHKTQEVTSALALDTANEDASGTSEDVSASVGGLLRQRRERFGHGLDDIASDLCIRKAYLRAIEESDFASLPGLAYATGFVRAYADHCGLDPIEIVDRFKSEWQGVDHERPAATAPVRSEKRRSIRGVAVGIVVVALGVGGYALLAPSSDDEIAGPGESVVADVVPEAIVAADPAATNAAARARTIESDGTLGFEPPIEEGEPAGIGASVLATPNASPAATRSDAPTSVGAPSDPSPVAQDLAAGPGPAADRPEAAVPAQPVGVADGGEAVPAPAEATGSPTIPDTLISIASRPKGRPANVQAPIATQGAEPTLSESAPTTAEGESVAADAAMVEPAAPPAAEVEAAQPVVEEAAAVPQGETFGAINGGSRVTIRAESATRLEITSINGEVLFRGVLQSGDSYRVPDRPGLLMSTENAGALAIIVDGGAAPAVGPAGSARQNVFLNPGLLREGRAAPR